MTNFLIPILQDISASQGIPTATISVFLEKRKKDLQEIILCEIRQGDFSRVHDDDKIAITYKLLQSAIEGVAKNNLLLMCQVINGMAEKNTLKAPTFLKYAQILASLSEDEITVLGIMVKHHPLSTEKNRRVIPALLIRGNLRWFVNAAS